jgi:hypothetical protein
MGKPYTDIFGSSFSDHKMEKIQLQAFETLRNKKGDFVEGDVTRENILCWDKKIWVNT